MGTSWEEEGGDADGFAATATTSSHPGEGSTSHHRTFTRHRRQGRALAASKNLRHVPTTSPSPPGAPPHRTPWEDPVVTHRRLIPLLALALAGSLAAAEPTDTVTDEAVVATDVCEPGPTADEAMLDAHDLCDVTLRVTTGAETTPTVQVTLGLADAPVDGTVFSSSWTLGDCDFHLRYEDDVMDASGVLGYPTRVTVGCGTSERQCTVRTTLPLPVQELDCRTVYGATAVAEIPAPTVDGSTVTFAVTFDGGLAPFAGRFAPGATLQQRHAAAGPDVPFFFGGPTAAAFACSSNVGCSELGGDLVLGGGTLTISER